MSKWELICEELHELDCETTHRLRITNGWLYKHQNIFVGATQPPATIVFVPDQPISLIDYVTEQLKKVRDEEK